MSRKQFNPYESKGELSSRRRRHLTSKRNKLIQSMLSGEGSKIRQEQLRIELSVVNQELKGK